MFDLGFTELALVALVALVVLGPERLPKAARFAGLWVRRARAQWYSVKSELEREIAAEELKRNLEAARTAANDLEREARDAVGKLDRGVRDAGEATQRELEELREGLAGAPPGATDAAADPQPDVGAAASDGTGSTSPPTRDDDAGR